MSEEILKLKKEIERLKKYVKKQRYGLLWIDVPEAFEDDVENKLPILQEVPELAIKNNDGKPTHILIEGDNYHALTCLNYTHKGKIDVIYIDPPYNTGAKSWRYNNNFVEKEDLFRHSKWLSFMKKRLELARDLLKDTGIIVATIDDYEIYTLGLLMDEIFGETNRIGVVVVENNPRGRTTNTFFATCHEYYLFYAKNINFAKIKNPPLTEEQKEAFNLNDDVSAYRLLPFRRSGGLSTPEERPNSYYPIYYDVKKNIIDIKKIPNFMEILPIDSKGKKRVWRQTKPSLMKAVERGDMVIKKNGDGYTVLMKDRIKEGRKPKTIWIDPKFDASTHGTVLLEKILGKSKTFDYPKSLQAVEHTLSILLGDNKTSIVLDFFAGSGTTGHATMELNHKDKGNRRFILVTNNENKIMHEVCYPRIKKAIEGYKSNNEHIDGLGSSVKYYKTAFIGKNNIINATDEDKVKLAHNAGELLAIAENTLELVKQNKYYQLFEDSDKEKFTAVYFREELNKFEEFTKMVEGLKNKTTVYVFSWGDEEFSDDFTYFKNVKVKTIPQPILEIYKNIYNLGI